MASMRSSASATQGQSDVKDDRMDTSGGGAADLPVPLSLEAWNMVGGGWRADLDWRSHDQGAEAVLRLTATRSVQRDTSYDQQLDGAEGKEASSRDQCSMHTGGTGTADAKDTASFDTGGHTHSHTQTRTLEYRRGDFFQAAADSHEVGCAQW